MLSGGCRFSYLYLLRMLLEAAKSQSATTGSLSENFPDDRSRVWKLSWGFIPQQVIKLAFFDCAQVTGEDGLTACMLHYFYVLKLFVKSKIVLKVKVRRRV